MPNEKTAVDTPRIIGKNWGISLTLFGTIVVGIVANITMMAALGERVSIFGTNLKNYGEDLGEIKTSVQQLTLSSRAEMNDLRKENTMMRERMAKLETKLESK